MNKIEFVCFEIKKVHSFTGSKEEAKVFTDMGYFIGINGCSLKTQENIDAMRSIPTEFLMLETGRDEFQFYLRGLISI